jgi:hypothetical protein
MYLVHVEAQKGHNIQSVTSRFNDSKHRHRFMIYTTLHDHELRILANKE